MNYRKCYEASLGWSDIATIIAVGYNPDVPGYISAIPIGTGYDGSYSAYIAYDDTEIGEQFEKVAEFKSWARIYDDEMCKLSVHGKTICVYKSPEGDFIVQSCGPADEVDFDECWTRTEICRTRVKRPEPKE